MKNFFLDLKKLGSNIRQIMCLEDREIYVLTSRVERLREQKKFCGALNVLLLEYRKGRISQSTFEIKLSYILSHFLYYENVLPNFERKAFIKLLSEKGLIYHINCLRLSRSRDLL